MAVISSIVAGLVGFGVALPIAMLLNRLLAGVAHPGAHLALAAALGAVVVAPTGCGQSRSRSAAAGATASSGRGRATGRR